MTTWIDLDRLLAALRLTRSDLENSAVVEAAIRTFSRHMPTYITLKDVKKRWGQGHEDTFPVAQFEQLWVDMTAIPEVRCSIFAVPVVRGHQLKEPAQLDGWLHDGSAEYVNSCCCWNCADV